MANAGGGGPVNLVSLGAPVIVMSSRPSVDLATVLSEPETWTVIFSLLCLVCYAVSIGMTVLLRQQIKPHQPVFSHVFATSSGRLPLWPSLQFRYALPWVPSPVELHNCSSSVRILFTATRVVLTISLAFALGFAVSFYLGDGSSRPTHHSPQSNLSPAFSHTQLGAPNHAFNRTRRYGPSTWQTPVAAGRLTWSR
jgi:hypothetical protein